MEPKYSILLCGQPLEAYREKIGGWLSDGIKVFWFGTEAQVRELKQAYPAFAQAFLLQAYAVQIGKSGIVTDGEDKEGLLRRLGEACPAFNAAQYLVEHCQKDEHIIVQASAGTGKTTVMIDRILFLLHTVPGLELSGIYMITFTNEAAGQMGERLQKVLMTRFQLTGKMKYFRWVEQQSQMNISTIHSFAYSMLKEYGIGQGFTQDLAIRGFEKERKELIRDLLDQKMDDAHMIRDQVGLPLYKAGLLTGKFWEEFARLGIARKDMDQMQWGRPVNEKSAAFQSWISAAVGELDDAYLDEKRKVNAIALNDMMRDLQMILTDEKTECPDLPMRYLFIDEFQDSDLSQIRVAAQFVRLTGAKLFVVGDVKQSIYRFRGANDRAFELLERELSQFNEKSARSFVLINNYRTAANIMNRMNKYFAQWSSDGLLKDDGPVVPFHQKPGTIQMIPSGTDPAKADALIVQTVREQLDRLAEELEQSGKKPSAKDRVVLLTRTNSQLQKLTALLKENRVPASAAKDGSFFTSEAVRDFYAMISSYLFPDEPKYIFNYLLTPYAGKTDPMDPGLMEQLDGDREQLTVMLRHFLEQTDWEKYYKEFRLRPVLAVIRDMIDGGTVTESFIREAKRRKKQNGWEEEAGIAAVRLEACQYQANLEKLLELLQSSLGGRVSLYRIYQYLQTQIAANRSESEPEIETEDDYRFALCMTVHKSKGLEFDTVILPYTGRKFPDRYQTELVLDPMTKEAGWNITADRQNPDMRNHLYRKLKEADIQQTREEETRILYVAMTRAISHLIGIVCPAQDSDSWSYLIEEVGIDDGAN